ncbi:MAG: ribosome biogenesis GTP-binding protein YihA/YsxC [Campylobacterota bacterium]|nr:ribosome biogenesis GTP-binding protein YihA/YsxC [Campylobacterota bacterium]
MIDIIDASFLTSAPNIKLSPPNELQNEVVFMARSNVGKSSLLNALTNRKGLAKVSATPGKTRLINYFNALFLNRETNEKSSLQLVDLPGFGYARVSKSIKSDWEKNLTTFIAERKQIKLFVHLIDARHPNLEIDRSVDEYLEQVCTPDQVILRIFTKIDKLNQKELGALKRDYPGAMMISNTKKRGIDKLTSYIYNVVFEENDGH